MTRDDCARLLYALYTSHGKERMPGSHIIDGVFERVQHVPVSAVPFIRKSLQEQDTMPSNFGNKILTCWAEWLRQNPTHYTAGELCHWCKGLEFLEAYTVRTYSAPSDIPGETYYHRSYLKCPRCTKPTPEAQAIVSAYERTGIKVASLRMERNAWKIANSIFENESDKLATQAAEAVSGKEKIQKVIDRISETLKSKGKNPIERKEYLRTVETVMSLQEAANG